MNTNIEISQFILSLVSAVFISGVAAYLGSLLVTKRMGLVGDAFAHLAFPGVALGLLYHFNIFWGALITVILGAILIWLLEIKTKAPMEALTGLVFAVNVAAAMLILPFSHEEIEEAFAGDITKITFGDTLIAAILSFIIFLIIKKIYPKIILSEISEDLAKVEGVNVKKYNFLYLACVAFTTALTVKIVGGLLPVALIVIPALTARNFSRNLFQYSSSTLVLGIVSSISGVLLFKFTQLPAGLLIILISGFFFLISLIFKK